MEQSWVLGLIGGLIIGTAGAVYLLFAGRILGPTATLFGIWTPDADRREKLAFMAGLAGVPLIISQALPYETHASSNLGWLVLGGLLVGFGTRLANGCTSGHGVCGVSRASPRSVAATVVFVAAGILTMALLRTILGVL